VLSLALAAGSLAGCAASPVETGGVFPSGTSQTALVQSQTETRKIVQQGSLSPKASAHASEAASPDAYKIGPQDMLEITVFKVPELSKDVQVADTGSINLPLVGDVQVAGKTPHDVEHDLTARLGAKYLRSPQVTVLIKEYNSQQVTVEGGVKKPGVYPVRGKASLLQYMALCEGLDDNSDSTAIIFREVGGKRTSTQYDVAAISAGQQSDPQVKSGDVVVVGKSAVKEAFNNFVKTIPMAAFLHIP